MVLGALLPWLAWIADGGSRRELPGQVSLTGIPDDVLQHPVAVVLKFDPIELNQITANPYERGRQWERVGAVAILAHGDVQFESWVGVRVHGGGSRSRSPKSWRLYFRPSLNAETVPGNVVGFETTEAFRKLVLHNDFRLDNEGLVWRYLNPLAFDIAERLGVPVAKTAPATVIVNDGPPLPYVIMESLDLDWLEARYGHRDFLMLETKGGAAVRDAARREGPLVALRARYGEPINWTLENVREVVDIDNLSRWFLATLFCGTRDELQGKMVLDLSRPEATWFWVAWDMDFSFARKHEESIPSWEFNNFPFWLEHAPIDPDTDARIIILRQLFLNSEAFRNEFAELYTTARDSILTPGVIEEELSRYESYAAVYGVTDTQYQDRVRDFLTHRPAALGEILRRHLLVEIP